MNYIRATIFLGFVSFINLMLAIVFNLVRQHLWSAIRSGANITGVYEQVNPHLVNYELVFWIVFLLSAVGAIIWFGIGSHKEEHEEYRG